MADNIDPRLEQAIIHTESSGRPDVIGDEGESIGLMQIQKETAKGLYKQGLLPKEWAGKKVKRKDLPNLLKDPDFNKLAGSALFVDNKKRIQSIATKNGIQLSPDQLNDLAIKSHNQGVTKTIKRELLGKEPTLPRVDDYLQKIKERAEQQSFQDGGFVQDDFLAPQPQFGPQDLLVPQEPQLPEIPTYEPESIESPPSLETPGKQGLTKTESKVVKDLSLGKEDKEALKVARQTQHPAVQQEYDSILADYNSAIKSKDEGKKKLAKLRIIDALLKFGAQYSAGKVQEAGKFAVKAPTAGIDIPSLGEVTTGPSISDIQAKLGMLKQLERLKGRPGGLTEYQKRTLGLQEESLGLRGKAQELREKELEQLKLPGERRRVEQFVHRKKEKDELSDKQTNDLNSLEDGLGLGNRMKALMPVVKENLGFYASAIEEGKRYIPYTEKDPDFVEMQQIVGTELADYIKTISGAAVSEQEAQRLRKNIPTMDDKPNEFERKLKTFMSLLEGYKTNKITSFKKQGKDPSRFEVGAGFEKRQPLMTTDQKKRLEELRKKYGR